jgi:hypothetical protein
LSFVSPDKNKESASQGKGSRKGASVPKHRTEPDIRRGRQSNISSKKNVFAAKESCMSQEQSNADITPDMSVLDVLSLCRETEDVFRSYDDAAGECICCNALFETLRDVAEKYNLDLEQLLADLQASDRRQEIDS